MSTLPREILQSLSEDGQRRYLNSLKRIDNEPIIDNFSFQIHPDKNHPHEETKPNETEEIEQTQPSKDLSFHNTSYSESNTNNSFTNIGILPSLPLSAETSSAFETPVQSLNIPHPKQKALPQSKTDSINMLNDTLSEQSEYNVYETKDELPKHQALTLEYDSTSVSIYLNNRTPDVFPDVDFDDMQTGNIKSNRSSNITEFTILSNRPSLISKDDTLQQNYDDSEFVETETETDSAQQKQSIIDNVKNNQIYLPEQSYEVITYEYYTDEELIAREKNRSMEQGESISTECDESESVTDKKHSNLDNKQLVKNNKIYLPEPTYEIITYEYYTAEEIIEREKQKHKKIVSDETLVKQHINKKKARKTNVNKNKNKKKVEMKPKAFSLSEKEKRLFIDNAPKIEARKPETNSDSVGTENGKMEAQESIDPFGIYHSFPRSPEDSIQIQRLALLLGQYQCFTETEKNQCIYNFICDGNIDKGMNKNRCKYNETLLLNDWYYTLVHFCHDNELFARLYKYITIEIGGKCDIEKCKFIKRNYKQNITNHDTRHYYGFKQHKQQTRIRLLDNIHCHILHSYDVGFKLTKDEKHYVEYGDEHKEHISDIDPEEKNLVDVKMIRLKRKLVSKKQNLKKLIGHKRMKYNKFVTQMFEENHNRKVSMLNIPIINSDSKRPTKIEINDNYQFGQKFYYWKYHKKAGWKWYIRPRYKDLKTEMISNDLLCVDEWDMYYNEASYMSETFLCKSYKPLIEKYFGNYFYGIRNGDILSTLHILSVLIFTNDYNLQLILNKSYTKRSFKESDVALKQRHSYYANWAKLLCETVEIFVNTEFYKPVDSFYHGTNGCTNFNEIYASLYAPTSMTKSIEIATCYSNDDGLLLNFMNDNTQNNNVNNNRYFECNWISLWSNENEIIFVGSAAPLKFKSVINYSLAHNYRDYISAITIIKEMLSGNPPFDVDIIDSKTLLPSASIDMDEEFSDSIKDAMFDLIDYQLKKERHAKLPSIIGLFIQSVRIADYIYEAFNHFVKNSPYHILFDLHLMNTDYKHVQQFFFTRSKDWIKLNVLCKLFSNIKYLSFLPLHGASECYALKLTRDRMINLYNTLQRFNGNNQLERISIEQPNITELPLRTVLKEFKPMFQLIGWKISCFGWKKYDTSNPQLIIVKDIKK